MINENNIHADKNLTDYITNIIEKKLHFNDGNHYGEEVYNLFNDSGYEIVEDFLIHKICEDVIKLKNVELITSINIDSDIIDGTFKNKSTIKGEIDLYGETKTICLDFSLICDDYSERWEFSFDSAMFSKNFDLMIDKTIENMKNKEILSSKLNMLSSHFDL